MPALELGEIRELLRVAEEEVKRAWSSAPTEGTTTEPTDGAAGTMLDRVLQIGLHFAESAEPKNAELAIDSLVHLYGAGGKQAAPAVFVVPLGTLEEAARWYEVVKRAYTLGAYCVQLRRYELLRYLTIQQPNPLRKGRLWFRDMVTALARLDQFKKRSLLGPISEYISERSVMYQRFRGNKDEVINQLCRFDFLQCVVAVAEAGDIGDCYPNFGAYYKERTEPIITELVSRPETRDALVTVSDKDLAEIIVSLDNLTGREFFTFASWDAGGWTSREVRDFLKKNGYKL